MENLKRKFKLKRIKNEKEFLNEWFKEEIDEELSELLNTSDAYETLREFDEEFQKYGAAIMSKDGEILSNTSKEEFDKESFIGDGWLYLMVINQKALLTRGILG